MKTGPLLNTDHYSMTVLIVFLIGCLLWVVVYGAMFHKAFKYKTMEYPLMAMACAYGWEIWLGLGIIKTTDMGTLLQFSYFLWFFGDCFILYMMFKYAYKQSATKAGQKSFNFRYVLAILVWVVIWYPFMNEYDDVVGAFSGWICNVVISLAFVFQKLKMPEWGTSRVIAVFKFLGTGLCSIIVFTHFMSNHTLVACVFVFASLDLVYIYLVFTGPKEKEVNAKLEAELVGA